MPLYAHIIIFSWIAFLVVWGVGAFTQKKDAAGRSAAFWLWRVGIILVVLAFAGRGSSLSSLTTFTFQTSPVLGWIGAACSVIGIGTAIWARVYLGRNWSSFPTSKTEHELVTGGPYTYVRHPIYTGMLLAIFGTIFIGYLYTILIFLIVTVVFVLRIPKEERIMLGLFPDQYPPYQARTKKLIPFIW